MRKMRWFLLLALLAWQAGALAQDSAGDDQADPAAPPPIPPIDAAPTPPDDADVPIPPKVLDENSRVEPTVEIRRDEDDNIIEEYRLEGRVYMVKVTPKNLPAYYLYDLDGDGLFEDLDPNSPIKPVYWKVAEWQ